MGGREGVIPPGGWFWSTVMVENGGWGFVCVCVCVCVFVCLCVCVFLFACFFLLPVFKVYKGLLVIVWWGCGLITRLKVRICAIKYILRWYIVKSWCLGDFLKVCEKV